jgi:hypothetical protein
MGGHALVQLESVVTNIDKDALLDSPANYVQPIDTL